METVRGVLKNDRHEVPGSTVVGVGGEGGGGRTMGEITNSSRIDPEEAMAERIKKDALMGGISQLPPIHQTVLMHKEGIFGHELMNNATIAMQYNLPSGYQVGKIHTEAKDMLRAALSKIFGNHNKGDDQ